MSVATLAWIAFWAAAVPSALTLANLLLYRPRALPGRFGADGWPEAAPGRALSVLIPARDEAEGIEAAVRSVLDAGEGVEIELVVLDDHSSDDTFGRVAAMAREEARLRVERAPPLPGGWCGKQHACQVLAAHARHPLMLFVDADVRLERRALARLVALIEASGADLLSGFPRQIVVTPLERLLIPLIHFVLLGFLPIAFMRWTRMVGFGAGCGQLMLVRREAYRRAGGHGAIRASLHDGVTLPRAFRRAGLRTELCDATALARCRMYAGARAVWEGLGKNATEGLASPALIVPMTLWLLAGQVLPFVLLALAPFGLLDAEATAVAALAAALVWLPRLVMCRVFEQPLDGAIAHPLGVVLMLAIQWQALWRQLRGQAPAWKGRRYPQGEH